MWRILTRVQIETVPVTPNLADPAFDPGSTFFLDFVADLEVDHSADTMTDDAFIVLPKNATYRVRGEDRSSAIGGNLVPGNGDRTKNIFQRGQRVTISVGYDYNRVDTTGKKIAPILNQIFVGYISDVVPNTSLKIYLQDPMFKLKQCLAPAVTLNPKLAVTLKTIVNSIVPSWCQVNDQTCLNATFEGWKSTAHGSSVAWELDRLKDSGFSFNFVNGVFYAGLRYPISDPNKIKVTDLHYEQDIIDDDDMVYRRPDDINVSIKIVSTNSLNKVNSVLIQNDTNGNMKIYKRGFDSTGAQVPDTLTAQLVNITGQQINLSYYGPDLDAITIMATEIYLKYMYQGFTGSLTTFLLPTIFAGEAVHLFHDKVPEKNGTYLVKRVVTTVNEGGGRQKIELDRRIL